jgi:hypothetical protein
VLGLELAHAVDDSRLGVCGSRRRLLVTTLQVAGPGVHQYGVQSGSAHVDTPLPPWLRWVGEHELRAAAVAVGMPHLDAHIDDVVGFLTSTEAQAWPHPACDSGAALAVPQRRRDSALKFGARNGNNVPGKHPWDWSYHLPLRQSADLGRLFAPHVIVDSLQDDVRTWDWSGLLPVLESSRALRHRMRAAAGLEDVGVRTDADVLALLVAAHKDRNRVKHDSHVSNQLRSEIVERYLRIALLCGASEDDPCVRELPFLRDRSRADQQVYEKEVQVLSAAHTHSAKWFQVLRKCGSGTFGCVFQVRVKAHCAWWDACPPPP